MRARLIFLVVVILAVAGFAALNWSEIVRSTPLSFGLLIMDAPLGLILLGIVVATLLAFLVSSATLRTQNLLESRHHSKTLEAQRDLADRAEASRFTELRQHMDTQLRENRDRESIAASELEKAMVQSQRELRTQLEQMNRALTSGLAEIENRIDGKLDRVRQSSTTPL